jgi:uncharacterized protein YidB (DUF937 family)
VVSGLDELLRDVRSGRGSSGGLGDLLGGILGGSQAGGLGAGGRLGGNPMLRMLLPLVASMLMNGGLQKLLSRLQAQGHGEQAQSWVGTGRNQPVDATDVRQALDDEELEQVAQQLGVSQDEAAEAVAEVLPDVVDQMSPNGELPDQPELDRKFGRLHELGGADRG